MTVTHPGRWRAAPYSYADARALAGSLGLSETVATVLVRRGLAEPEAARRFLEASETHDPLELAGMEAAVELVLSHVERGSTIAVHGDYDVDGVSSTALLVRTLRALGADVRPRLPSRSDDGYGLSRRAVEELHARGSALLLTVDCGIGALEEVRFARQLGMDVIVTDHHRPESELPECPVIHPVVGGYPCEELCATGVAFKVAQALFTAAGRDVTELEAELDLVALATVADLVPLRGENRTLVRRGLKVLAGTRRVGLRELMRVAGVDPQSVTEQTLGFGLAPRINAAGRLYRADAALELLLTDDEQRAREIARELDAVNAERQAVEMAILISAEEQLSRSPDLLDAPVHVLASDGWHPGVIGIVASRLVERHHRPCVMIALDGGRGRGSARSIQPYDLHAGLASASRHLERFGGHRMAAGLEIEAAKVEPFRAALAEHARGSLSPEDLVRKETVDAVVPGDAISLELAEELQALRPFGMGNPAVNLMLPAARVAELRPMGEGKHARFTVTSAGVRARAVAFGVGDGLEATVRGAPADPARRHDVTARLEVNEWGGAVEPRLVVRSVHAVQEVDPCAFDQPRPGAESWWRQLLAELDAPLGGSSAVTPPGVPRTVVDRRGQGALGLLAGLMTTGEALLVVCADVSRRRGLFGRELAPERFERPPLSLLDHASFASAPEVAQRFTHIFVLDPPSTAAGRGSLELSGTARRESFLHLAWGPAEVDFAARILEHELVLRPSLASLYRALSASGAETSGEALAGVLAGPGPHPRNAIHAARCLRVLVELGLVAIERSSATVRCTITSAERVSLERSSAYTAYARRYEEELRFLSEQTGQTKTSPMTQAA